MDPDGQEVVELRVAACASAIATVRAVASDLARRAELDHDAASDVRMAVDEACTQLAKHSNPTQVLQARFHDDTRYLWVTITARINPTHRVDTTSFGWRVLGALTDELELQHDQAADGDVVTIRLAKGSTRK